MKEQLTPQQRQAVENRGGMLLVSAAAGSGKTKVLVDRLMKYIMDPASPANIDDFLMITYTKAAAAELRGKIAAKLSEHIAENPGSNHLQRQMQRLHLAKISTVHAYCTELLRQYASDLDLPADFRVGDENECRQLRDYVFHTLAETVDSIACGSVDANPYTRGSSHSACAFCPYGSICAKDREDGRRNYKAMTAQDFWERIGREEQT